MNNKLKPDLFEDLLGYYYDFNRNLYNESTVSAMEEKIESLPKSDIPLFESLFGLTWMNISGILRKDFIEDLDKFQASLKNYKKFVELVKAAQEKEYLTSNHFQLVMRTYPIKSDIADDFWSLGKKIENLTGTVGELYRFPIEAINLEEWRLDIQKFTSNNITIVESLRDISETLMDTIGLDDDQAMEIEQLYPTATLWSVKIVK